MTTLRYKAEFSLVRYADSVDNANRALADISETIKDEICYYSKELDEKNIDVEMLLNNNPNGILIIVSKTELKQSTLNFIRMVAGNIIRRPEVERQFCKLAYNSGTSADIVFESLTNIRPLTVPYTR